MNTEGCMKAMKCPICKRLFYPTPQWGWTVDERRFCRYSCMREAEKKRRRKTATEKARELNEKRVQMVKDHAPAREINAITRDYERLAANTP